MNNFRSDIHGLRAIAVIGVLLFHSNLNILNGGYIGVDIFFIISGYLIIHGIFSDLRDEKFSFKTFYLKRFLRIFPVLFFILGVSTLIFGFILPPKDFEIFGTSLLAQSSFISNIYFMLTSGYFDISSEYKPLLHTWSLAVEEQFYLIFPIIIYFFYKYAKKYLISVLFSLLLISLIYSIYLINIFPYNNFNFLNIAPHFFGITNNYNAGFYLIFSRAWEFIIGGVLAYSVIFHKSFYTKLLQKYNLPINLLGLIGLFIIIYCYIFYNSNTPFPGLYSILPIIGVILIIMSNNSELTLSGKIISGKILNFFANISYSLYLWHWIIFVIMMHLFGTNHSIITTLFGIIISILLSCLTYKFIEQKFRYNKLIEYNFLKIGFFSIFIILIFFTLGASIKIFKGFPGRIPEQVRFYNQYSEVNQKYKGLCHNLSYNYLSSNGPCTIGTNNTEKKFIIIGDSHALEMIPGIDILANKYGTSGYAISFDSCLPLNLKEKGNNPRCNDTKKYINDFLLKNNSINNIIYIYSWNTYIIDKDNVLKIKLGFDDLVKKYPNKDFFAMMQVPELKVDPTSQIIRKLTYNLEPLNIILDKISISKQDYIRQNMTINDIFKQIHTLQIIDHTGLFFDNNLSKLEYKGDILYRDKNHINTFGANYVSKAFIPFFEKLTKNN